MRPEQGKRSIDTLVMCFMTAQLLHAHQTASASVRYTLHKACKRTQHRAPLRRDEKPSDEGTPWGEQEELEQSLLQRSGVKGAAAAAAAEAAQRHPSAPPEYEFVEDDHIDFVVLETIKGNLDNESSRCGHRRRVARVPVLILVQLPAFIVGRSSRVPFPLDCVRPQSLRSPPSCCAAAAAKDDLDLDVDAHTPPVTPVKHSLDHREHSIISRSNHLRACSEDDESREQKAAAAARQSKQERIQAQRAALPSAAYKDEFVKAVLEHQVRGIGPVSVPVLAFSCRRLISCFARRSVALLCWTAQQWGPLVCAVQRLTLHTDWMWTMSEWEHVRATLVRKQWH